MDSFAFEHHLTSPQGRGRVPADSFTVTSGGGSCCDQIRFSVSVEAGTVSDAGFDALGCGAATAAASAAVTLVRGQSMIDGQIEAADGLAFDAADAVGRGQRDGPGHGVRHGARDRHHLRLRGEQRRRHAHPERLQRGRRRIVSRRADA